MKKAGSSKASSYDDVELRAEEEACCLLFQGPSRPRLGIAPGEQQKKNLAPARGTDKEEGGL